MNVQFAIQGEGDESVVYVLEVNPRASRNHPRVIIEATMDGAARRAAELASQA